MKNIKLPKAKTENLVVQDLKDESLIYDQKTHKAFCLNDTLAKVFNACDGKRTFAELRHQGFTDDLIHLSLDELKAKNLLEDYQSDYFGDLSRREVIKRVGLASMIALPVIAGLSAPLAAHAQSVNVCAANNCKEGFGGCGPQVLLGKANCAIFFNNPTALCCFIPNRGCACALNSDICTQRGGTPCP